jgi:hypothetical protein
MHEGGNETSGHRNGQPDEIFLINLDRFPLRGRADASPAR